MPAVYGDVGQDASSGGFVLSYGNGSARLGGAHGSIHMRSSAFGHRVFGHSKIRGCGAYRRVGEIELTDV